MTTDFRAVFGQFYGLPCSRYGLSCRKYGLPCNFWKSESHISPVLLGTSRCHINGLELNRVLRLYLEGTGRSLGAGRPSKYEIENEMDHFLFPYRYLSFQHQKDVYPRRNHFNITYGEHYERR